MEESSLPLTVISLEISLRVRSTVTLPQYTGSSLRGAVEECVRRGWPKFYAGFDPAQENFWINAFWESQKMPRPFSILVYPREADSIETGETFRFGIALYGSAEQFWKRIIEQIVWWGLQQEYREDVRGLWNGNFDVETVECRPTSSVLYQMKSFIGREPYRLTLADARAVWRHTSYGHAVKLVFKNPVWLREKDGKRWVECNKFDLGLLLSKIVNHAKRLNVAYGEAGGSVDVSRLSAVDGSSLRQAGADEDICCPQSTPKQGLRVAPTESRVAPRAIESSGANLAPSVQAGLQTYDFQDICRPQNVGNSSRQAGADEDTCRPQSTPKQGLRVAPTEFRVAPKLCDVTCTSNCRPVVWDIYSKKEPGGPGQREVLRGLVGEVIIRGKLDDVGPLLLFGSWIGAGKGTAQGLGFYELVRPDQQELVCTDDLMKQIAAISNLSDAYDEVLTDETWEDDPPPDKDLDILKLSQRLLDGSYRASSLRGEAIPTADSSFRYLGVPCLADRVAQQAVLQVLRPIVDSALGDSPSMYSGERSRYSVARHVSRLGAEGYRYAVHVDISDFFDFVNHRVLLEKLGAIVADDEVLSLIREWVSADVIFNDQQLERDRGLPQGMVLSPMLANVHLGRLDDIMERKGYKLVRFSDDFVILCREKEQAEGALRELGITVSSGRIALTHSTEGSDYLGFLFVQSLITPEEQRTRRITTRRIGDELVLIDIENTDCRAMTDEWRYVEVEAERGAVDPLLRTIRLATPGTWATKSLGRLRVMHLRTELFDIPLSLVEQIVVAASVDLSHGLMRHCLRSKIPVVFLDRWGKYEGRLGVGASSAVDLWEKQFERARDGEFCLKIAKELVRARMSNLREVVRRHRRKNGMLEDLWHQLGEQLKFLLRKLDIEQLEAVGRKATAAYFEHFHLLIGDKFRPGHHSRRPPADPVNVLLSLGYTILHYNACSLIEKAQLCPSVGFLHPRQGGSAALASDMIEPFTFLVDQTVIRAVNRLQLRKEHFRMTEDPKLPCVLTIPGRKLYLAEIEAKLSETVIEEGKKMNWRRIMDRQVYDLRRAIEAAGGVEWEAFRLRGSRYYSGIGRGEQKA